MKQVAEYVLVQQNSRLGREMVLGNNEHWKEGYSRPIVYVKYLFQHQVYNKGPRSIKYQFGY